jgi:hypothetical protein
MLEFLKNLLAAFLMMAAIFMLAVVIAHLI